MTLDDDYPSHPAQVWRTLVINGRRTTVRLETVMWSALDEIAEREHADVPQLCSIIDRRRGKAGLAPSIRVLITAYYRKAFHQNPTPYRALGDTGGDFGPLLTYAFNACGPEPEPQPDDK
ncbi:hypothetical protein CCP2SC5_10092 [Azospirillaceae bacterium]